MSVCGNVCGHGRRNFAGRLNCGRCGLCCAIDPLSRCHLCFSFRCFSFGCFSFCCFSFCCFSLCCFSFCCFSFCCYSFCCFSSCCFGLRSLYSTALAARRSTPNIHKVRARPTETPEQEFLCDCLTSVARRPSLALELYHHFPCKLLLRLQLRAAAAAGADAQLRSPNHVIATDSHTVQSTIMISMLTFGGSHGTGIVLPRSSCAVGPGYGRIIPPMPPTSARKQLPVLRVGCLLLGDPATGKTSLVRRRRFDSTPNKASVPEPTAFSASYEPTVGVELYHNTPYVAPNAAQLWRVGDAWVRVVCSAYDTSGDPSYASVRSEFYTNYNVRPSLWLPLRCAVCPMQM